MTYAVLPTSFACLCAIVTACFMSASARGIDGASTRAEGRMAASTEEPFLAENRVAMDKMMLAMNVDPSGDVDRDFAAMMTPHHQGAIDMAQAELRYGRNEQLRRLAQEIIVEQQQEIVVMRQAIATAGSMPLASAVRMGRRP